MHEAMLQDFAENIGEVFAVSDGGIELLLEDASELPRSVRAGGSFRLVFRGPHQPILSQAIHRLRRVDKTFDIFIVPLQPDAKGVQYEAIFN